MARKTHHTWRRALGFVGLGATVWTSGVDQTHAVTVFDPANFSVNSVQAARALVLIQHDLEQIQNQILMLKDIDLDTVQDIHEAMQTVQQLMQLSQDLGFSLQSIDRALGQLFPEGTSPLKPEDLIFLQARWDQQRREAALQAMRVQAAVVQDMAAAASRMEQIGHASRHADGQKGAIQANTQMLGHLSSQLQDLQATTVWAQRLAAIHDAEQAVMQDYFRRRRLELHSNEATVFIRPRVSDPFPRAR